MAATLDMSIFKARRSFWLQHREAALNWLALGLLLAAWNAADGDVDARPRPATLRGHACVSVRAARGFVGQAHDDGCAA
jgi:hypothetical protein